MKRVILYIIIIPILVSCWSLGIIPETYEERCPPNQPLKDAVSKIAGFRTITSFTINGNDAMDTIRKYKLDFIWDFEDYDAARRRDHYYGDFSNKPCAIATGFNITPLDSLGNLICNNCGHNDFITVNKTFDSINLVMYDYHEKEYYQSMLKSLPIGWDSISHIEPTWLMSVSGSKTILTKSVNSNALSLTFSLK